MSGTIAVTPDKRWSAAGWLFDWTVGFLAENAGDAEAVAQLREVIDDNIGWVGLEDFDGPVRDTLLDQLKYRLVDVAEETLPDKVEDWPSVLAALYELSEMAQED